ncbi:uncharacterized protein LOC117479833 [Trematomus bernacchii]|uniref:uncharacterized protein LOC117479833 n=1 Tax=Trematomus bernacchii TaxID=40690 RepID=UPI00146A2257|nr:uncharacterized protein LOC117479833 [Trematomus bernacchii]
MADCIEALLVVVLLCRNEMEQMVQMGRLYYQLHSRFMLHSRLLYNHHHQLQRRSVRRKKIMLKLAERRMQSSFAEISGLERTVSEPPLPSACSSPVRMEGSPLTASSSSQECLVNLIQPVGRNKQVKRKRDSSSGLLSYMEKSDVRDERLLEQGQVMLQEVHTANTANADFLKVFSKIEENSHSMLGLVDRIVKVMETNKR